MTFLLRLNIGRRRLPEFVTSLSRRIGRPLTPADVLPLELGDRLWEVVLPALHAAHAEGAPAFSRWAPAAVSDLDSGLAVLTTTVADRTLLYLPWRELGIGPVAVSPEEIAPHIRAIAEGATEECTLVADNGRCGLRLDYHASDYDHGEPFPYELTVWGPAWQATAQATLPFASAAPAA